ncbi:MAG: hypothetical protein M3O89_01735 [Actinomycetota bacterium]|nr:hypothetical protein [Actinomycetota bacterium]
MRKVRNVAATVTLVPPRMLETEPDGMRVGDIIVTQNLPRLGTFSIVRVVGSYYYEMGPARMWGDRFGHVLPVELLARAPVELLARAIDRASSAVSEAFRRGISLQPRLYNITPYGGGVEALPK